MSAAIKQAQRRFDARQVVSQTGTADLDFHGRVALGQTRADFIFQLRNTLAWRIPATTDVTGNLTRSDTAVEALGQHSVQGLVLDLGDSVPERHFYCANGNGALGMATGLLALHHAGKELFRCEIGAAGVQQGIWRSLHDARNQPVTHLRTAGVTPGRVEGVTRDRTSIADHVGYDSDHRGRHFAEVKSRISQRRTDRDADLTDGGDLQNTFIPTA